MLGTMIIETSGGMETGDVHLGIETELLSVLEVSARISLLTPEAAIGCQLRHSPEKESGRKQHYARTGIFYYA